jgi:hypothetical protein
VKLKSFSVVRVSVIVFLFFYIFVQKVYAYLDPGTGSYIFQIIIATLIGGFCVIKTFWNKIINFFKNLFSKNKKQ